MRLFKMELYKLTSKKIFLAGAICVVEILLFSFGMQVGNEKTTVDGITHTGYRAVQVNRQITKEFKGILNDEKIEQIVEKYGFPHMEEKDGKQFWSMNFLNQFVMDYVSDGYFGDEYNYEEATCTYPIEESNLGKAKEITGKEIVLEYYDGWKVFLNILSTGMILGSILVLCGVSNIFAGEGQTKMLQLSFTTREGRKKDIYVKIAAAFTAAGGIWLGVVLLDLLLCGTVYGFGGLNCYNGMVQNYLYLWPERMIHFSLFLIIAILFSLFGILFLCAITIYISACFKSSFHAVVSAAVWWGVPILLVMFAGGFNGIFKLLGAAPVFMVVNLVIAKVYDIWPIVVVIAVMASVCFTIGAYRKYEEQQVI